MITFLLILAVAVFLFVGGWVLISEGIAGLAFYIALSGLAFGGLMIFLL